MDSRIETVHTELRKDILRLLDDKDLKNEITMMMEDKIDSLEFNFNSKILSRLELLEKAYESNIKNYQIFDNKLEIEATKSLKIEDTLRD